MTARRPQVFDVVVVGAGAVGASVAYELARRGVSVRVVDAGTSTQAGCSYANAGLISPSHVEPLATPANVREGLRHLWREDSPFYVAPSAGVVPFLAQFAASARPRRVRLLTERMRELAARSLVMHQRYASAGLTSSFRRDGMMDVFLTEDRLAQAGEALRATPDGLRYELLDAAAAREMEPTLGDVAGGLFRPDEAHCDSAEFVSSMLEAAQGEGARVDWGTRVTRLVSRDGRVVGADTPTGTITGGHFVVAAGLASADLCRSVGVRLPMQGGRGYVVDTRISGPRPRRPLSVRELRVVATPYPEWFRMCGTMELAPADERMNPRRIQAIRDGIARTLPGLRLGPTVQTWAGQRPCTADGVPVIGRSRARRNLVVAAGHGMWGLTLGPVTGEIVATGLVENAPTLYEAAFSPDRFHHPARRPQRDSPKGTDRHAGFVVPGARGVGKRPGPSRDHASSLPASQGPPGAAGRGPLLAATERNDG